MDDGTGKVIQGLDLNRTNWKFDQNLSKLEMRIWYLDIFVSKFPVNDIT